MAKAKKVESDFRQMFRQSAETVDALFKDRAFFEKRSGKPGLGKKEQKLSKKVEALYKKAEKKLQRFSKDADDIGSQIRGTIHALQRATAFRAIKEGKTKPFKGIDDSYGLKPPRREAKKR